MACQKPGKVVASLLGPQDAPGHGCVANKHQNPQHCGSVLCLWLSGLGSEASICLPLSLERKRRLGRQAGFLRVFSFVLWH